MPMLIRIDDIGMIVEQGKLHLSIAIDRISKFASAQLYGQADRTIAVSLLEALIAVVPYQIHTILTDKNIQLLTCRATGRDGQRATGFTASTRSAASAASSIASPSQTTLELTAEVRSSG